MKKILKKYGVKTRAGTAMLALLALICLAFAGGGTSPAFAYPTYSSTDDGNTSTGNCATCHGPFNSTTQSYRSLTADDPVSWGESLMQGHVHAFRLGCNDCHEVTMMPGVKTTVSITGITCVSCHGRVEDANGTAGKSAGSGLRQHHFRKGITICSACHTKDSDPAMFTPVGENIASQAMKLKNIDPCNDSQLGNFGLDNDGDLLRDENDPDCAVQVIEPSAGITANGSGGPVTVARGAVLTVEILLDPVDRLGEPADFWVSASTPMGNYVWVYKKGWGKSESPVPAYQGRLMNLAPTSVLRANNLPAGNYIFRFTVDDNMDSQFDGTWSDSVNVTITP